jgi:hypothetical protein
MYCILINDNESPLGEDIPQMCRVFDRKPSQWDFSRTIHEFLMDGTEVSKIQGRVFELSTKVNVDSTLVVVTDGDHKNFVGVLMNDFLGCDHLQVIDMAGQSVIAPRELVKAIA